jgi:ADP-heptose:LPS heptosyltransferase
MKKILIIRFSSIGDIVLTTPIIRCVKLQTNCELHYLTKPQFATILEPNIYIDKIMYLDKNISITKKTVKSENYDCIIDLHHNIRSNRITFGLSAKIIRFNKINIEKWFAVNFKKTSFLPKKHIVDRYFEAVSSISIKNDGQGLDYFIPETMKVELNTYNIPQNYIAIVLGATYFTKKYPASKMIDLLRKTNKNYVLLGVEEDKEAADLISNAMPNEVINLCGKLNLHQSASIIQQSYLVITNDTGLMHIAAALRKPIVSIWGNTIPEFGMYPYYPIDLAISYFVAQNKNLNCRPCSKIGFHKCPKKHFKCMNDIDNDAIAAYLLRE